LTAKADKPEEMAMGSRVDRPCYGRADLAALQRLDRAGVLAALGSFDERGLDPDAMVLRTASLLADSRVPGLAAAVAAADPSAVASAVHRACLTQGEDPADVLADGAGHVQVAEAIVANRFSFYGEEHSLPERFDWDANPGTGHWSHDLNRFSYLSPLTRACLERGEPAFGRKAVELILEWIDACDFGQAFVGTPYVFGSYLNQAIHCEAWGQCLRRLLPTGVVAPFELLRILKSLHDQLAYLEIVTRGHSGNWPTIGCRGILGTLSALAVFRDTDRWARYSLETLAEQAADQVLPDGVQDELTPHYHWVVVHNLLAAARSAQVLGYSLDPATTARLATMIHYLRQTVVPDGSAQVAFNDGDPAAVPDATGLAQRYGLSHLLPEDEPLGPELFPWAGVALLRQRADRGDLYLAFDGGPFGRGHQHEDKLGFWLFAHGRSLLVDPGRHLYDSSPASYRAHLCSTRAHSTGLVDGQGQHSRGRPETWIARQPVALSWRDHPGELRAAAAYDLGYGDDNGIAVVHHREIVLVQERFWLLFDRFTGTGEHEVERRFQYAPGPLQVEGTRAWTGHGDANLLLWSLAGEAEEVARVEAGQQSPRGGWYSARYGQLEPAPCLVLSSRGRLPRGYVTLLFPYRGVQQPRVALELAAGAARVRVGDEAVIRVPCSLP
jgi:hypothetical protein